LEIFFFAGSGTQIFFAHGGQQVSGLGCARTAAGGFVGAGCCP
jgi:hypothetical protein